MARTSAHTVQAPRVSVASADNVGTQADAAARLISEAANDLRSPLTTVRESIRMLRDGDLGELSSGQRNYLASALDQCSCMEHMIGELLQMERLRSGTPRVNRQRVSVADVRRAVDETIRPWLVSRQIDVLWDGVDTCDVKVFADAEMLRRMIVNLVTNAIRATAAGGCILIRLEKVRGDEAVSWSVLDRGSGISESQMQSIADQRMLDSGGEGLGLAICRQLAALHFSTLKIRSRVGSGTEVTFQTPTAGPRSIAEFWSRWRVACRGPLRKPHNRDAGKPESSDDLPPQLNRTVRRTRIHPPSITIDVSHQSATPRSVDRLAAGVVSVGAAVARQSADKFDHLLQSHCQFFDLVYRVDPRRWVWVFDSDEQGVKDRIELVSDSVSVRAPEIRLTWSEPQMIPIDSRRTHSRLNDLLIRETLSASASSNVRDANEVRLGTAPLAYSETAATRLDQELRHLTNRLQSQTKRFQDLARQLRPESSSEQA